MKIILGKQIEEVKKKDSENEKNLLKNRNSVDVNELYEDDVYFHSNAVKNIKLGTQLVNRIYLNHSIVYNLEDTILLDSFHSLVPNTATEIKFLYASNNPDLTNYQKIGYCDVNNFIEVWNNGTKYIIINPRKNYIYAPTSCYRFLLNYTALVICNIENFNTQNVTNMHGMFHNCSSLTSLDLSSFNTANVTDMMRMFSNCRALTSLDLTSFNTEKVKLMSYMFEECRSLTTLDVSNFKTENVTYMIHMFYACSSLITLISNSFFLRTGLQPWSMFTACVAIIGGNGTTYDSSHLTAEYARVDGENGLPGYFTAPANNNK